MIKHEKAPAAGTARALKNVCSAADVFRDTAAPNDLQARRICKRFKFSPEVAALIAAHAFGQTENWGCL